MLCDCRHDVIAHAWERARCKGLDSYGVRCSCTAPRIGIYSDDPAAQRPEVVSLDEPVSWE